MSAETLRRAAALMREDTVAMGEGPRHFVPTVADLIDNYLFVHARETRLRGFEPRVDGRLLAVARAYLGESA